MKKKAPWIIGGAILVVAVVLLIVFALGGKETAPTKEINLEGTWKVAVYVTNQTVNIVDQEYMVFDKETVKDYRDGATEPFVSSKYTLNENDLSLSDISKNYTVDIRTDNYIRLYESENTYLELIRYQNSDMSTITVSSELITGKWNIIFRNTDQVYAGDYLSFDNGTIGQYKAGAADAVATSDYEISNNHLIVNGWGKDMVLYPLNNETIIMVELTTDEGFIWELQKEN